jgi:hypothetical protein
MQKSWNIAISALARAEASPRHRPPVALVVIIFGCLNVAAMAQESGAVTNGDPIPASPKAPAQASSTSVDQATPDEKKDEEKEKRPSRGSFVVAPLPTSSSALGTGVIPVLGYIFPFSESDKVSPPSTIGAAGLFTNNGSRGFALGGQLFFKENTYQVTTGYAHGNLDYNIYGPGILTGTELKLPLKQTGQAFFGEVLRRLWWQFFLGPRFFDGNSDITLNASNIGPIALPPNLGIHTTLRSIGFHLKRDTRPNHFYPTAGTLTDFASDFFTQSIGSKYSFQSYKLTFNKYQSLTKNQVLAFGSYFCGVGGQPPFYGNCIYGAQNQLRGYTAGRYFDRYMMASQLEYRLALPWRLGLVAFGGIGGVIPGADQFLIRNSYFLPSAGGGLRFELSKKYHVNLRADLGYGKDGHTFGLGVGEAF